MRVVLITGASRGIGASIALEMSKCGYFVIINYKNSEVEAKNVLKSVKENSDGMLYKCDITNEEEVSKMVDDIICKCGSIDVLVNNAGIAIDSTFDDKKIEDLKRILDVNLIGTFIVSRCVGKYMLDNKNGNIINISSTNGIDTYYEYSLDYDASKAGVISLTHNLSSHYSPYIRVNAICPGWVNTDMNKELDSEYIEEECKNIKLGRFAEPEEIAKVVRFIASDEASYINDSIIRVDGGVRNE